MQLRSYGRDTDTIRTNLIDIIRSIDPTLTQFTGSDPGSMIIDAVCAVADSLNYYIDRQRLESYVASCTQEDSLLNHAVLSSYFIRGVQPPTVEISMVSKVNMSFNRKQIEFDGEPYIIVDTVILDESNSRTSKTIAYNGRGKTAWKNTSELDKFDPRVIIDSSSKVPYQGLEVFIEFSDGNALLNKKSWFPILRSDGRVEIAIRDNRIKLQTARNIVINYIEIEESNFAPIPSGVSTTIDGIVITTTESSTSGSGAETFNESRLNIIRNNMLLDSLVSVIDFETMSEQDLEVRRAKCFDINTPDIVTGIDSCKVFLDLKDSDKTSLPSSTVTRVLNSYKSKTVILGITPKLEIAPKKLFDLSVRIFTYSPEMIELDIISQTIKTKYTETEFGERVSPGDIAATIKSLDKFIEYVEVVAPAVAITPKINEVPKIGELVISLELVK